MSSFLSRLRRHKLLLAFLPALIFLFCSVFYYEINHSFVAFCDTVFRNEITENTLNLHYTLENPEILNLSDPDVSFGSMNPEVLADSFSYTPLGHRSLCRRYPEAFHKKPSHL